jgi:hypothetical protein
MGAGSLTPSFQTLSHMVEQQIRPDKARIMEAVWPGCIVEASTYAAI